MLPQRHLPMNWSNPSRMTVPIPIRNFAINIVRLTCCLSMIFSLSQVRKVLRRSSSIPSMPCVNPRSRLLYHPIVRLRTLPHQRTGFVRDLNGVSRLTLLRLPMRREWLFSERRPNLKTLMFPMRYQSTLPTILNPTSVSLKALSPSSPPTLSLHITI